jgi:hypothetical protein
MAADTTRKSVLRERAILGNLLIRAATEIEAGKADFRTPCADRNAAIRLKFLVLNASKYWRLHAADWPEAAEAAEKLTCGYDEAMLVLRPAGNKAVLELAEALGLDDRTMIDKQVEASLDKLMRKENPPLRDMLSRGAVKKYGVRED